MTVTIDTPPDISACSTCMQPLTWVWVHRLGRNVAFTPEPGIDRSLVRLHTCDLPAERTWRHIQRMAPETARRGAARARAVLARATREPR